MIRRGTAGPLTSRVRVDGVRGNIVPDFLLINKSFSFSGGRNGAGFKDGFEQLHFAGAVCDVVAENEAEAELGG